MQILFVNIALYVIGIAVWTALVVSAAKFGDNKPYISDCRFPGLWIAVAFFGWIPIFAVIQIILWMIYAR